jgi:hypothetical protein
MLDGPGERKLYSALRQRTNKGDEVVDLAEFKERRHFAHPILAESGRDGLAGRKGAFVGALRGLLGDAGRRRALIGSETRFARRAPSIVGGLT